MFSAELEDLENNMKPITSTPRALRDFISFSEAAFDTEYSLKLKSVQMKSEEGNKQNIVAQEVSSISVEPESEEPKQKEDTHVWNSELTDESQSKADSNTFSFREDVIHKTMIRAVKRFYTKLFKQEFPKLFRKRIINVRVFEILDALEKMCETYIGSECSASIAEFLLKFLGLKPKNIMQYSFSADKRAEIAISCMYNYSYGKFAKLCKVREFCLLFEHLYENHLDVVFEAEKKTLKLHNGVYRGAFQNLYVQCKDN